MSKTMLIDAAHAEETRVVVLAGQELEEFDVETKARQQIRGNIYLAKVTRVEPSLQAAFVDFGSIRHGFLAFSEVHPDYYQIPIADREALIAEEAEHASDDLSDEDEENGRARRAQNRRYKIQDVLRRRQIMLVQAVKEERGNKGAALTTYLSLAGRYCVLMPNTPRGGGISRKISAIGDRKRLKAIVNDLHVPKGMGLIIRTAGAKRNKTEIKRDYEYLLRLWDDIRERTLESVAPCLIHEEESLVKRAIRDLYNKDVGSIVIEGENAYREAKDFVKMLIPSHARKVHQYKNSTPLFSRMGVDSKLAGIHDGVVQLKSGGYIVINQTEALVAIDVNSGKSTKERSIEQTALKTNLEAADEVARQMRLRDLAGLIVIDFIDMDEPRNDRAVEKRMKDALRLDRARVQMGKISGFGLMEISRQRRRTGVLEGSSHVCSVCSGFGRIRSVSSTATQILREIEASVGGRRNSEVEVRTDIQTALYILNEKRRHLASLEALRGIIIKINAVSEMPQSSYEYEIVRHGDEIEEAEFNFAYLKDLETHEDEIITEGDEYVSENIEEETKPETETPNIGRNKRRRLRRRGRRNEREEISNNGENISSNESHDESNNSDEVEAIDEQNTSANTETRAEFNNKRRRRGRRGGRNRRESYENNQNQENTAVEPIKSEVTTEVLEVAAPEKNEEVVAEKPKRAARKPRAKAATEKNNVEGAEIVVSVDEATNEKSDDAPKPKRKRPPTKAKAKTDSAPEGKTDKQTESKIAPEPVINTDEYLNNSDENGQPRTRKTGWWARNASKLFGTKDE